jgi:ADP-ribosylglycohydrolase
VECFHRDPREGYSGRFHQFLKKHKTGAQFLADINPTSDKSGAAMRAAPIGTYPRISEVVEKCAMQARITHDTADGTNAALAVSVGVHYFLYGLGPKSGLPQYIKDHVNGNWSEPWLGEVGSKAYMSVRAAITSILMNNSLSSILRSAVAWGGDTDTTASIAMRLASCCNEITKDLPENLLRDLEDGD